MRIGDAAAAAGMIPRALRYYEQHGLVRADRTPSGHRVYGPEHVRRLRALRELLDAGLTVGDLRAFEPILDTLPPSGMAEVFRYDASRAQGQQARAQAVARSRLADLDARIERLSQLRERLALRLGEPPREPGRVGAYTGRLRE